jgi:UDP-2,4-diacetamido-2,4,6-trideoxy-beta-L-altropyranose hydrolase
VNAGSAQLRVALRADGGTRTGLGHAKRSLALANAFRSLGAQVRFVADVALRDVLTVEDAEGVEWCWISPPDAARDPEGRADSDITLRALGSWLPNIVVADHYGLRSDWYNQVRAVTGAELVAIDDLGDRDLPVDWLVDGNMCSDVRAKYAGRVPASTRILSGPRFALLSRHYSQAAPFEVRHPVRSIGVSIGGVDAAGWSSSVVHACRSVAGFSGAIEVATSGANPHLPDLRRMVQSDSALSLTVDAPNLVDFLGRHELVVGAGGSSAWERCCLGVPSVVLMVASNQEVVVPELVRQGLAVAPERPDVLDANAIGAAVASLMRDPGLRKALSERGRAAVDGHGSRRVAVAVASADLHVRIASMDDAALVHQWRNASPNRSASLSDRAIPFDEHCAWMQRVIADPARILLVGEVGTMPVGVIRFDDQPDSMATVSLYLDPLLHGLGLGPRLLQAGEAAATAAGLGAAGFLADVLDSNQGSRRLFAQGGYMQIDKDPGRSSTTWRRPPCPKPGANAHDEDR